MSISGELGTRTPDPLRVMQRFNLIHLKTNVSTSTFVKDQITRSYSLAIDLIIIYHNFSLKSISDSESFANKGLDFWLPPALISWLSRAIIGTARPQLAAFFGVAGGLFAYALLTAARPASLMAALRLISSRSRKSYSSVRSQVFASCRFVNALT